MCPLGPVQLSLSAKYRNFFLWGLTDHFHSRYIIFNSLWFIPKSLSLNPYGFKYQLMPKQPCFGQTRFFQDSRIPKCVYVCVSVCVCVQLEDVGLILTCRNNSIPFFGKHQFLIHCFGRYSGIWSVLNPLHPLSYSICQMFLSSHQPSYTKFFMK